MRLQSTHTSAASRSLAALLASGLLHSAVGPHGNVPTRQKEQTLFFMQKENGEEKKRHREDRGPLRLAVVLAVRARRSHLVLGSIDSLRHLFCFGAMTLASMLADLAVFQKVLPSINGGHHRNHRSGLSCSRILARLYPLSKWFGEPPISGSWQFITNYSAQAQSYC